MTEHNIISASIDRAAHTILVVDDNPATRYTTARVVRAAGFQVSEAASGGEALALVQAGASAVVLDVHLPDMNGFEVCGALRANPATATLPVVHLSAEFVQNKDKVTGLNAGADAYLVHPVEPAILIATLQALIRARLAEERLRGSEARFRAIYDQAPIGIALIDDEGRFFDVNPALETMLRRERDAMIGQPVSAMAPADWIAFIENETSKPTSLSMPWKGDFPLCRGDGTTVRLAWTLSAHIESGLRIGIAVDVSEQFELERRRQEVLEREQVARASAERQSRTKDDFVAVLSHELRNPLNAIAGWVHLLTNNARTSAQVERGLAAIDRGVKAQARLISDILDVSRIGSGKLRLHREWVSPAALVSDAIEGLSAPALAKRVSLVVESAGAEGAAWLDATRFQQIVWNLVSNAIKFSNPDSQVFIRLRRDGEHLHLEVQDSGRGIRADFLPYLFERFTQSESPDSRVHGGLGLGLSIAKNLAEMHDGAILAESAGEGRGTTMKVTLLAVPAIELQAAVPETPPDAADKDYVLDGLDILVVEDDADAREIMVVVLSEAGARVRHASHYEEALRRAEQAWPDVLVSDIGMPGHDGYDLIRALRAVEAREARPRLFAFAHTAFARPQDSEKARSAGFDSHLGKPLQPHALLAAISAGRRAR